MDSAKRCAVEFKHGDAGYKCLDCSADASSMICIGCFKNGSHPSHRFELQPALPGRSCVCGDTNVWQPAGCCKRRVLHCTHGGCMYIWPTDSFRRHAEGSVPLGLPGRAGQEEAAPSPGPTPMHLPTDKLRMPQAGKEPVVLVSCGRCRAPEAPLTLWVRWLVARALQLFATDCDAPAPHGGGQELREHLTA
jgi:hypothetical protein